MSDEKQGPQRLNPEDLDQVTGGGFGSGVVGGGLNYQQITDSMGQNTAAMEANLHSFSGTLDSSSAADLMKLQNLTQQWTMAVNLQSDTMKMIGDSLKGIVQKFG